MNAPQNPDPTTPSPASPVGAATAGTSTTGILSPEKPTPGMVNLTHIIYALHGVSVLAGVIGAATVVGMMVTSWPSLLAVVLNYFSRSEVQGTWLESHFRWQIRTFWFALLWAVVAIALIFTIIGMVVAQGVFCLLRADKRSHSSSQSSEWSWASPFSLWLACG